MRFRVTALRAIGAIAALAVLSGGYAWIERESIARRFAQAELDARKVQARYEVVRIGPKTQRFENLVIGDPAHPDLTARWVEVDLALGLSGATIAAVRAEDVQLNARLIDGQVSFGAVDRLLPASTGEPFALPGFDLALRNGAMRLETPAGMIGVGLNGRGPLRSGFAGHVAVRMPQMASADCTASAIALTGTLSTASAQPHFVGPLHLARADCRSVHAERATANLDVMLGEALDRWRGKADLDVVALAMPQAGLGRVSGPVAFDGSAASTKGNARLIAVSLRTPQVSARDVGLDGTFEAGRDPKTGLSASADGALFGRSVTPAPALLAQLSSLRGTGQSTPLAPLVEALSKAVEGLSRGSEVGARFAMSHKDGRGQVRLSGLSAASRSGARLAVQGEAPVIIGWPQGTRIAGQATLSGGGFPTMQARFADGSGLLTVAPFASGSARIALTPVRFASTSRGIGIDTVATIDGPLASGRVEGLRVPVALAPGQRLPQGCLPVAFRKLSLSTLTLAPARVQTCLSSGQARLVSPRLSGRLGSSPIALAAAQAVYMFEGGRFSLASVKVALGDANRRSHLDLASLTGATTRSGAGGRFAGGSGQIGAVPILLSEAAGHWRFDRSILSLHGTLRAADASPDPRYSPLISPDFALKLADGRIDAQGSLRNPGTGIAIGNTTIRHRLDNGTGQAVIDIPDLRFGQALQPEQLTPITLGVIANVSGAVRGRGVIDWTPDGVKSSGAFRTDGMDMAAAFGPVTGLSGEIRLSDLLGLETPAGQEVRIAGINPGVLVTAGVIRYRMLPGLRIAIESGEWPFAGGKLSLEPTILDLNQAAERRLTFKVEGLDAARFIAAMEFENIATTGVFDGELPMVFDKNGGRIEGGRLVAREGGGTLSYIGQISNEQLGPWGQIAFDALKAIKYSRLSIDLDGALDGDVITRISFAGVNQATIAGPRAKLPIPVRITGLDNIPFVFNVTITAKFRQLFEMARSFNDPSVLLNRMLPQLEPLPKDAKPPVKPAESGTNP